LSEFPWSETFTIIGVIVGFSLSQCAILIKAQRGKKSLKKALIIELTIAKDNISYARQNNRMPKDRLPLITEVYDSNKSKLASVFNAKQLSSLHTAYARIKQVSSPMKNGNTLSRGYLEIAGGRDVLYQHDLSEDTALLENILKEVS
jgi:hypothetical protein